MLEAEIAEALEIARHKPPYNRAGKKRSEWYLKLHLRSRKPRFVVTRVAKDDGGIYLGPVSSKAARSAVDALRDALPLNRCTRPERCHDCAFRQMGACVGADADEQRAQLQRAAAGIVGDHTTLLDGLTDRMTRLAGQERYEEAAELRDRASLLERMVWHDALARSFRDAGDIVLRIGSRMLLIRDGRLAAATTASGSAGQAAIRHLLSSALPSSFGDTRSLEHDVEVRALARWVGSNADDCELMAVSGTWCLPARAAGRPRFKAQRESERVRPR
jgi:DNA polymerase III subunit epsilon